VPGSAMNAFAPSDLANLFVFFISPVTSCGSFRRSDQFKFHTVHACRNTPDIPVAPADLRYLQGTMVSNGNGGTLRSTAATSGCRQESRRTNCRHASGRVGCGASEIGPNLARSFHCVNLLDSTFQSPEAT
jgi:hypothetical protein